MDVRIVKAGQEHFSLESNAASLWSDPACKAGIGPDIDNPSFTDSDCLGPTSGRIDGVYAAAVECNVGWLGRRGLGSGDRLQYDQRKKDVAHNLCPLWLVEA
jgi:hypothetical protein